MRPRELVDADRLGQPASPARPRRTAARRQRRARAASRALLPISGCASSARWYAASVQVGSEERLEAATQAPVDPDGLVAPEHAVVDDHQLRACRRRPLEQLERGRDSARDLRHLVGAEHLQPGRAVLGEAVRCRGARSRTRMISSRWATGPIIATLCALGVWRSLVARSVRVGEVRSSNLRTPMSVGEPPGSPTNLSASSRASRAASAASRSLRRGR